MEKSCSSEENSKKSPLLWLSAERKLSKKRVFSILFMPSWLRNQRAYAGLVLIKHSLQLHVALRRLERVFRCYIVCETKEDYKEGCLKVWANYISPCSSIVGLYFKSTYDVISVTMAMHKVHKSIL